MGEEIEKPALYGVGGISISAAAAPRRSAAEKVRATLQQMATPDDDAEGLELGLAGIAVGLLQQLGGMLDELQNTGKLDEFVHLTTAWMATHHTDGGPRLVVVQLPADRGHELPPGTRLKCLDDGVALGRELQGGAPPW